MFKTLLTLTRSGVAAAGEELADRNALLILDQQMRDATAALERAKRSLALAIAQDTQEGARLDRIKAQVLDLENRVTAALDADRQDAAREGAEAIAALEAERDSAQTARALFATEISKLRHHVSQAENRMSSLDRGRRIARASQSVRSLRQGRIESALPYQSTLSEAEATLKRLRERQTEAQLAEDVLDQLDVVTSPLTTAEKLAAEGFGPRLRTTADDVLARLKTKGQPQSAH